MIKSLTNAVLLQIKPLQAEVFLIDLALVPFHRLTWLVQGILGKIYNRPFYHSISVAFKSLKLMLTDMIWREDRPPCVPHLLNRMSQRPLCFAIE